MRKLTFSFLANFIFLIHLSLGVFLLVGWYFNELKILYIAYIFLWLAVPYIFGYCPLARWEFLFRNKINEQVDIEKNFIRFYLKKFFDLDVAEKKITLVIKIIFLVVFTVALFK